MGTSPSSKWTTKHHFKDPVLELLTKDDWVEPVGVILFGTSDNNAEKIFNSRRAAEVVKAINPAGVIVECDGWGNNHVDWINLINEIGKAKIPLSGISYKGINDFVVKSKYLTDNFVDADTGIADHETCIVGQNSACIESSKKVIIALKKEIIKRKGR